MLPTGLGWPKAVQSFLLSWQSSKALPPWMAKQPNSLCTAPGQLGSSGSKGKSEGLGAGPGKVSACTALSPCGFPYHSAEQWANNFKSGRAESWACGGFIKPGSSLLFCCPADQRRNYPGSDLAWVVVRLFFSWKPFMLWEKITEYLHIFGFYQENFDSSGRNWVSVSGLYLLLAVTSPGGLCSMW